jgi:hypothetical protein
MQLALESRNEVAGVLFGSRSGSILDVESVYVFTGAESTPTSIECDRSSVMDARAKIIRKTGKTVLGEWHSHPWDHFDMMVLLPQLSELDETSMLRDEIEVIVTCFPYVGWGKAKAGDRTVKSRVDDGTLVRFEAWIKDKATSASPCNIILRRKIRS